MNTFRIPFFDACNTLHVLQNLTQPWFNTNPSLLSHYTPAQTRPEHTTYVYGKTGSTTEVTFRRKKIKFLF